MSLQALSAPSPPVVAQRLACRDGNLVQELHLMGLRSVVPVELVTSLAISWLRPFLNEDPCGLSAASQSSLHVLLSAVGLAPSTATSPVFQLAVGPLFFHPLWVRSVSCHQPPSAVDCLFVLLSSAPRGTPRSRPPPNSMAFSLSFTPPARGVRPTGRQSGLRPRCGNRGLSCRLTWGTRLGCSVPPWSQRYILRGT